MKVYTAVVFILAGLFSIHFYYRNKFSKSGILLLIVMLMPVLNSCKSTDEQPIKVGILHSLTGTMAISEKAVVDGSLLAIEEINQLGGINGQKILPLVVDGKSDLQTFEQEAERLITKEKVSVVFGCWTSASRKTVLPVFEKHNHLLFYPVQYEGLEQSPNIIYNGAAPNQQIIPAVKWCLDNLGKRFFLVGSDYVFPRTANEIIKQQANLFGAKIVGEDYILLGSSDVKDIIQKIIKTKPDVIINTINGDSNIPFFIEIQKAGLTPNKIPVMSFSISEEEIGSAGQEGKIPLDIVVGNYAAWNYFQSIESEENKKFVEKYKKKYGAEQVISDPVEAGYFGVYLWAQAVKDAGTSDVHEVLKTIKNQSMHAPEGMVYIDADNNHTWKTVRIGKIKKDGQFQIVWSSNNPVRPIPYPATRNKIEWAKFLSELLKTWDGKWERTK
jgi:urea transport system substrate-binding protein